jgi:hypothetical protein
LYSTYITNLKLATIVLALLASISSLSLSLNVSPILLTFNKYAFAQQNPVLPNYKGDYRANEPSKVADSLNNSTSNKIQHTSLAHYHPITPTVLHYSSKFDSAGMNSIPTLGTSTNNLTNSYSLVQPVSLAHYQPITPAASQDPTSSTGQSDSGSHGSSSGVDNGNNYSVDSSHHSSNDNSNNDFTHYNNDNQKSSSSDRSYNIHNSGGNGHHSVGHHGNTHHGNEGDGRAIIISSSNNYESFGDNNHGHSHYHGSGNDNGGDGGISITSDGDAFASDGGGAFASAGVGGAFASAGWLEFSIDNDLLERDGASLYFWRSEEQIPRNLFNMVFSWALNHGITAITT